MRHVPICTQVGTWAIEGLVGRPLRGKLVGPNMHAFLILQCVGAIL